MPAYLQGADLTAFGVPTATEAQIISASSLIDAYLGRREGLLWVPDANGNPCYMQGATPSAVLTLAAAIAPGSAVQATFTGPLMAVQVGDVLVLDIGAALEACSVQGITGQTVTLTSVQFAHAAGVQAQAGLVITEQRTMPQDRPLTAVARTPVAAMPSGVGRYGYMRRGDDGYSNVDTYSLLAVMSKFGGPPAWEPFTPQANSIDPLTGQVWIPAGVLLAYYTEVRLHYVAGWQYATLPAQIKQACANIINNQGALVGIPGSIQKAATGAASLTRFAGANGEAPSAAIDTDTAALLAPYKARVFA